MWSGIIEIRKDSQVWMTIQKHLLIVMVLLRKPWSICFAGIFRNSNAGFLGAFALHMSISNALEAEITVAMIVIETSYQKGCILYAFKQILLWLWKLPRWFLGIYWIDGRTIKLLRAYMTFIFSLYRPLYTKNLYLVTIEVFLMYQNFKIISDFTLR
jgi:hypothetical protein